MPYDIGPKTSTVQIQKNIIKDDREALRKSAQRREQLQKLAIINSSKQVYVQITGDSAWVDLASGDSEFGYTDRIVINVRLEIPDQVQTNLDEEVWDMMVQKTDLYHELGHIKWTDWPSFEKYLKQVADAHKAMFKNWWDAIEDAAIEPMLIQSYNIKDDLRITNENLMKANPPSKTVSLHEATMLRLMEYKHAVGHIDDLLDPSVNEVEFLTNDDRKTFEQEIQPEIEQRVPKIIQEPDGQKRNEMVYELYEAIGVYFDKSINPGMDEDHNVNFPDDSEHEEIGEASSVPDDAEMEDLEVSDEQIDPEEMQSLELDAQRDYKDQVDKQQENLGQDDLMDSMEEWGRVIDNEYEDGVTMSLRVPDDPPENGSYDDKTYQEAKRLSNPLAKELRQRLQQQRKTQKQSKKKSGKIDSKRAHKANQGNTNVFTRHSDPDAKDYACMIALDRSGSMSTEVGEAEKAAGALAFALEELDIEVGQIAVSSSNQILEKDFSETVDGARKKMFRGYNSGGTPLADALGLARARLDVAGKHPFMIVITDGRPDHRERYRDQLDKCDFPVLGVYLDSTGSFNEHHMNENPYFHALELRKYTDALDGVKAMVRQAMF